MSDFRSNSGGRFALPPHFLSRNGERTVHGGGEEAGARGALLTVDNAGFWLGLLKRSVYWLIKIINIAPPMLCDMMLRISYGDFIR